MRNTIFITVLQWLLALRYRITVNSNKPITAKRNSGILFLANHPALIDPIIVMSRLYRSYRPRPLADETQMNRPGLKYLFQLVRPVLIPDIQKQGKAARHKATLAIERTAAALQNGDNVLLYPAGQIYRSDAEQLGANSAVETIVRQVPDVTIALVRTTGLWGSAFSHAHGIEPKLRRIFPKAVLALLGACLIFLPRRRVTIDITEATDFPKSGPRSEMNRYMEVYFNKTQRAALHVPYHLFGQAKQLNPTHHDKPASTKTKISPLLRRQLHKQLSAMTHAKTLSPDQSLALHLGMDSLQKMELATWLEKQFKIQPVNVASLETVQDVYHAAAGKCLTGNSTTARIRLDDVSKARAKTELRLPLGETIPSVMLQQALKKPQQRIIADPLKGAVSYRQLLISVFALKPFIKKLPGERVGIMLPASVGATVTYIATLFAGKTPVLFNFTAGQAAVSHGIRTTGVQAILTSSTFTNKLKERGLDYTSADAALVPLESLTKRMGLCRKLRAVLLAHLWPGRLNNAPISKTAAILFTSGSEATPKAVPLTHQNILSNLRALSGQLHLRRGDRLLGILPPFHSFGLTGTVALPLCMGLPTVYSADPTESDALAQLISTHRLTTLLATPTFLSGILQQPHSLQSIRLTFVGAESCPSTVYEQFSARCPNGVLSEGYGITECAPVISMNSVEHPVPESIGKVLPGIAYAIVNDALSTRVPLGTEGTLLVRGPNVFSGYLNPDALSPFVQFENHRWYNTQDVVSENADGSLKFKGRKKRFIKVAGEMISLPAIEAALAPYAAAQNVGAMIAVTPIQANSSRLALFTTVPLTEKEANDAIRNAGLSSIHRIHKVIHLTELPTLGSGKIDYRILSASTTQAA